MSDVTNNEIISFLNRQYGDQDTKFTYVSPSEDRRGTFPAVIYSSNALYQVMDLIEDLQKAKLTFSNLENFQAPTDCTPSARQSRTVRQITIKTNTALDKFKQFVVSRSSSLSRKIEEETEEVSEIKKSIMQLVPNIRKTEILDIKNSRYFKQLEIVVSDLESANVLRDELKKLLPHCEKSERPEIRVEHWFFRRGFTVEVFSEAYTAFFNKINGK